MDNISSGILLFIQLVKVGIIAYGISKYKTFNLSLKVLYFIIIASFLTDSTSYILYRFEIVSAFMVNIYTIVEGLLFLLYFHQLDEKWALPWAALIFVPVALVEWIAFAQNSHYLDIATVVESCLLIVFSLRFFARMLGELNVGRLYSYPYFWINCAVLIYFSGSLFIFAFSNIIMENALLFLWHFHNFIQLIYLLLISVAFWKVR